MTGAGTDAIFKHVLQEKSLAITKCLWYANI